VKIATKVGISKKLWAQEQPNFLLDEVYEEVSLLPTPVSVLTSAVSFLVDNYQ